MNLLSNNDFYSHHKLKKMSSSLLCKLMLFTILLCANSLTSNAQTPVAETGTVSNVSSFWQTVTLSNNYSSMVVIASMVLANQDQPPFIPRIRNAVGDSFEISLEAPEGLDNLFDYDVIYFVVEAGVYSMLDHGIKMEAVRAESEVTASAADFNVFEEREFQNTYTNPVVVGQVMTNNDVWSVFWASSNDNRIDPPNSSSFAAGKHVAEDMNTSRLNETIGYVVFEAGNSVLNGMTLFAAVSDDEIRGTANSATGYAAPVSGLANIDAAIVSSVAMDGANGGWPVLFGETPLDTTQISLAIDEDTVGDAERSHTTEQVAYVAFDTSDSQPPVANISLVAKSGVAPLLLEFDGSGSTDNKNVVDWQWDFGDGNTANGEQVNHTYTVVGSYIVTLTVTDEDGLQSKTTESVYVISPSAQIVSEVGVIESVTDTWQVVNLLNNYTSMVVIASLVLPDQTSVPAVTRLRNTIGNSFELRVQNPSDSPVVGYDVHYVVVEEGIYTLEENGVNMEALRLESLRTSNRENVVFEPRSYQNRYFEPVVLGQVMSANDDDWSVFWSSAEASRNQTPNSTAYSASKNVAEDLNNSRLNETLGVVVVESGKGRVASFEFLAAISPDMIRSTADSDVGFNLNYGELSEPRAALVSTMGVDGGNFGWPILFGDTPLTNSILTVSYDEDQVRDDERFHTTEQVGYIIFGNQ